MYKKNKKKVIEKRDFLDNLNNNVLNEYLSSSEFNWNNIKEISLT